MLKNIVLDNLENPEALEDLYRTREADFVSDFEKAIQLHEHSVTLEVWRARLYYLPQASSPKMSLIVLVSICFLAFLLVKVPTFLLLDNDWYYSRFIPLIVLATLTAYFLIIEAQAKLSALVLSGLGFCALYLSLLPDESNSASITMALIHVPLLGFSLLAISFMSVGWSSIGSRLGYIRYVGEMGIYTVLVLLGGMVLTAITLGLFEVVGLSIRHWYLEYVVVLGLVSAPVVSTYIYDAVQHRESRFAAVLSNVFSPLFLITVMSYLMVTLSQGKSPFTDRNFLITFNGLLVVILAITIFSISGKKRSENLQVADYINVALISATLIVNIIALSAIVFRWAEYGLTVNRIVVTGANLIIFVHLIVILTRYIGYLRQKNDIEYLEAGVANYLPIYTVWSFFVSVIIPLLFSYS